MPPGPVSVAPNRDGGLGCLASAQLASAPPPSRGAEKAAAKLVRPRRVSEALVATCSPAAWRTSPAPAVLPFACLPAEQSRRERPPKQGWLCLQQAPWDGRAWGPGTGQRLPSSTWPTGHWNLPWGAVATQVVSPGQSGSLGIRPQGLKAGRRAGDMHVGPVPWLTRELGL